MNQNLISLLIPKIQNINDLNISDIDKIELPCSILLNIQKLSLNNLHIKFISEESNISLNRLIHLKIN